MSPLFCGNFLPLTENHPPENDHQVIHWIMGNICHADFIQPKNCAILK